MDYRRHWQQTRLRRTRLRLLLAGAVGAAVLLAGLIMHYAAGRGAVWVYTPAQPGLAHFAARGEDLCVVSQSGRLVALEVSTGAIRERVEFHRPFPLLAEPVIISGCAVFGADDGRVRCLDLKTGEVIWEATTGGAVRARPTLADDRLFIGSDDGYLYCLEASTGIQLWRVDCGGKVGAQAAVTGQTVVVGTVDNGIVGLDSAPARRRWRQSTEAPVLGPAAAYAPGKVVVGSDEGRVYLIEAASGRILHKLEFLGLVRARPVVGEGRLVVADDQGRVVALGPDQQLLWSRQVKGPITCGLVATRQAVYLSTASRQVLALRASDGRLLWRQQLPAPAAGSLQVTDTLVLVGLVDGRICAFRRPAKG